MPVNAAGQPYAGFAPTGVAPSARRTQYRNAQGELVNDTGDNASQMYASLVDPSSDASRSFNFMGTEDNGDTYARQLQGMGALGQHGVQADLSRDNEARAMQLGLASAYRDQIAGVGPSMATYAGQRAQDQAAAAAASGRVGASAAGQRLGMLRGGAMGLAGAQDAARARSDEVFAASTGYGGLTNAMRGADANAAFKQAGINLQQRGLDTAEQSGYEDAAHAVRSMAQAGATARSDATRNVHELGVRQFNRIEAANQERRDREKREAEGLMQTAAKVGTGG
jgi:hypothetical protein